MEWEIALSVAISTMLVFFFAGIPVFITFLIINIVGVTLLMGTAGFGMFVNSIYQSLTAGSLTAVPMFILMGEILFRSDAVNTLISAVERLVGQIRGRDYILITTLSTVFGALCGSALAVAALMGRTVMTPMARRGYDTKLTSGAIVGGATLAAVIPPSVGVVIVGSLVNVSIASMLIAGIIPGIFISLLILGYNYVRILLNPTLEPPAAKTPLGTQQKVSRWSALLQILPFTLVIFSVMGLMMLGIATPSESAATGVLGALVVAMLNRRLTAKMFTDSLISTVRINAMILIILASSKLFGQLLSFIGASSGLMRAMTAFNLSGGLTFLVLMAVPFFLCMFIDVFAVLAVAIPIYLPLVKTYGYDPLWFWMLFLINLALGSITPPFGYTLFALKVASPGVTLSDIFKGAWPIVVVFIFGMTIMFFFPSIITFLPSLF